MRTLLGRGITILIITALPHIAAARSSSHSSRTSSHTHHAKSKCAYCARDSRGKIKRNPEAKHAFRHSHPCRSTGRTSGACPGYVIDHVQALKHGGADSPSNMQWQTVADSKAKDRVED
jgi:hypothetical protein